MRGDERIGDRWEEVHKRIEELLVVRDELQPHERDFLYVLNGRLLRFKTECFISAKQLNWLTQMEAYYHERDRHGRH